MKVKKVKINLKSLENIGKEAAATMRSIEKGEKVSPTPHEIVFSDFAALRGFLTPKRLELIRIIRQHSPDSIAELARLANRDFARVYQDVQKLTHAGLIDMPTKSKGARAKPAVAEEIRLEIVV